jgi:hypothetical protein
MPEPGDSKKAQAAREALDIIEEISIILVRSLHSRLSLDSSYHISRTLI